jgi:hypothetical protein
LYLWKLKTLLTTYIYYHHLSVINKYTGYGVSAEKWSVKIWTFLECPKKTINLPQVTDKLFHIILYQAHLVWVWVVGFTTTYAISAYHHWCCEFESWSGRGVFRFPPPIKLTSTI